MNSEQAGASPQEFESWGIQVGHPGVAYSRGWDCTECKWRIENYRMIEWQQFAVGFSKDVPENPDRSTETKMAGGIVIQCPRCSKKFWFHISLELMEAIHDE
jgi:hypothetical protein